MGALGALSALQRALRQVLAAVTAMMAGGRRLQSLEGQLALVTGAGAGLGRELAVQLSGHGCGVICVDTDLPAASSTADLINDEVGPGRAVAYAADTADRLEALQLSREVLRRHGAVDLLVLAAPPQRSSDACRHLTAQFWVSLGFVPAMLSRGAGHVLAVCTEGTPSDAASTPSIATTSLIEALSEQLRGTNVRLTCAHRYQLSTRELQLAIPELGDECVAAEMLAALRRGERHVILPARPLFWQSVLRSLHMGAEIPHRQLRLPMSALILSAPAAPHSVAIPVKS